SLPPFTALSRQGGYAHTLKGYFYTNLGAPLCCPWQQRLQDSPTAAGVPRPDVGTKRRACLDVAEKSPPTLPRQVCSRRRSCSIFSRVVLSLSPRPGRARTRISFEVPLAGPTLRKSSCR